MKDQATFVRPQEPVAQSMSSSLGKDRSPRTVESRPPRTWAKLLVLFGWIPQIYYSQHAEIWFA